MADKDMMALILGLSFFALIGYLTFLYITKKENTSIPQVTNYYVQPPIQNCPTPQEKKEEITTEKRPKHPHIINYSIHEADKWYEIKFPRGGVKAWSLKCRENHDINYCFEPSHSTFMTLIRGATLSEDTAPEGIHAIYVKSSEADVTMEVELWKEAPSLELFP